MLWFSFLVGYPLGVSDAHESEGALGDGIGAILVLTQILQILDFGFWGAT
jgi:hypothetical protein